MNDIAMRLICFYCMEQINITKDAAEAHLLREMAEAWIVKHDHE